MLFSVTKMKTLDIKTVFSQPTQQKKWLLHATHAYVVYLFQISHFRFFCFFFLFFVYIYFQSKLYIPSDSKILHD